MKNYAVYLTSIVDAIHEEDWDNPNTKEYLYEVEAETPSEALAKAKELHPHSVWESDIYED